MADELKVIEGTLTDIEDTLYTAPLERALIISELRLTNKSEDNVIATIKVGDDTVIFPNKEIEGNDGYVQAGIHTQVLAEKTIKGEAGKNDAIDYYISGIEVDA